MVPSSRVVAIGAGSVGAWRANCLNYHQERAASPQSSGACHGHLLSSSNLKRGFAVIGDGRPSASFCVVTPFSHPVTHAVSALAHTLKLDSSWPDEWLLDLVHAARVEARSRGWLDLRIEVPHWDQRVFATLATVAELRKAELFVEKPVRKAPRPKTSAQVTIRRGEASDLPFIGACLAKAFAAGQALDHNASVTEEALHLATVFLTRTPSDNLVSYVAERDGTLVGHMTGDAGFCDPITGRRSFLLLESFVIRSCQDLGVSTALLRALEGTLVERDLPSMTGSVVAPDSEERLVAALLKAGWSKTTWAFSM